MLKKLIRIGPVMLILLLMLALTPACSGGIEEPELTPTAPTSEAEQNFLIEVTKPDDARQSEWAFIFVYVTCKIDWVDEVEFGTIGISFPDLSYANNISYWSCTLDRHRIYKRGEGVYTKYGYGSEIRACYPIIEGYQETWARDARENITFQVRPEHAGTFTFYVKAYGSAFIEGTLITVHEPLSGETDQQEEYVQVHSFQVAPSN